MAFRSFAVALALTLCAGFAATAEAAELNIYSGRHYESDLQLYQRFEAETGIKVNYIEGKADELLERIAAEGQASPADVFITADAGNLWRAESRGLLQPAVSETLTARIPEAYRDPGNHWFGVARRVRVIMVASDSGLEQTVKTYADLARPELKGKLCMRSGSNIYNLSLTAALIETQGAEATAAWAKGVVANLAKDPSGGDTDQIKSVAAGVCAVTISNTYYLVRLMKSKDEADRAIAAKIKVIYPDQDGAGAHVNISGAGVVATAPNPATARAFIEFLASDEAQRQFALGNNEYPVALPDTGNAELDSLGTFKASALNVAVFGKRQAEAQQIIDRAGWK